jgi:hypothetical protein
VQRENAGRVIEEVRGDELELAKDLRIERVSPSGLRRDLDQHVRAHGELSAERTRLGGDQHQ